MMPPSEAAPPLTSGAIPEMALDAWSDYLDHLRGKTSERDSLPGTRHAETCGTKSAPLRFRPFERFTAWDEAGAPEFVVLPPGRFLFGAHPLDPDARPDEKPRREIFITHAFALGIVPVTFAQWDACLADNGTSHRPSDANWGRKDRPVINVSWHDAEEYLGWLTRKTALPFRLPSEIEWEYACQAGASGDTRYPWGDDMDFRQLGHHAWYQANSEHRTQPVGNRAANAWGLFDLLGNVTEWVADHYTGDYSKARNDGAPWRTDLRGASRVLRGGSWLDAPRTVRPTARDRYNPDHRSYRTGFRIALSVTLHDREAG